MTDEATIRVLERVVVSSGTITSRAFSEVHPEVRGLSLIQYRMFALIATAPDGVRVVELARRARATPQPTTRITQRLEARGLVWMERGTQADRRAVVIRLTDLGERTWSEISKRRRELLEAALEGLTLPADAQEVLEAIAGAFERYTA